MDQIAHLSVLSVQATEEMFVVPDSIRPHALLIHEKSGFRTCVISVSQVIGIFQSGETV